MINKILRICTVLFIIILFCNLSLVGNGSMNNPASAYKVGDYWDVKVDDSASTMRGIMHLEIISIETITVNGEQKEGFIAKIVFTGTVGIENDIDATSEMTFKHILSDFSTVETNFNMKIKFTVEGKKHENDYYSITTYEPPQMNYRFPLNEGDKWTSTSKVHDNTSTILDGFDFGYELIEETEIRQCEVLKEEKIAVPVGTFNCYPIKRIESDGNYSIEYFSSKVGNTVKLVNYDKNNIETGNAKLISYSYTPPFKPESKSSNFIETNLLLILIFLIIVIIVIILLIWIKKRKKSIILQKPIQPQTLQYQQYPQQTTQLQSTEYQQLQYSQISQPTYQKPICQYCYNYMEYIQEQQRWYCYNCQRY